MCLEVYSDDQPIQIPFGHETFRFLGPTSFRVRYAMLVRNPGYRAIDKLTAIYPRPIYDFMSGAGKSIDIRLERLEDITDQLPVLLGFFDDNGGGRLRAQLPDPNNPVCNMPGLSGQWHANNVRWDFPEACGLRCANLLDVNRFTIWNAKLHQPIAPGESHWFCWQITVRDEGDNAPHSTIRGPVVFHEIASPIDVRRTVVEFLQTSLRDIDLELTRKDLEPALRHQHVADKQAVTNILIHFGLHKERRVDIQYYELTVQTGDPQCHWLHHYTAQGDIRMRSGSPRFGRDVRLDAEFLNEPVYEWKTGSLLEPAHPWKNSGFAIRMELGYDPERTKPLRIAQADIANLP